MILYTESTCPDDCTSPTHGICVEGECICNHGFSHGDYADNCGGKVSDNSFIIFVLTFSMSIGRYLKDNETIFVLCSLFFLYVFFTKSINKDPFFKNSMWSYL